ncbi:BKACE family enzyme [Amycolatopsis alkalitolerans]|uniref:3-keto-5-aminohexanoate cleavage protein n=1 Tax=Amycolatopsis alkalitolerans TaxID=2547244 RepID=A0A5C4M022_9PSEU|nr:3-keto-5-aminohexanoate cleavage protein [Amycolatopsis alkalitolerans]TNC25760.1 3-keto-5-aminohexanoate cleavage protein [Amycolatopsis alkalitolerans]
MTTPAIITVAITGAVPTKSDNPAVPVTPEEQIASAVECFEAGATVCHVHVRDDEQQPSADPARYAAVRDGIREACPQMVVQMSTGARGRSAEERFSCLELRPEMASLATGSVNFPGRIYDNAPDLVERAATRMRDLGIKPEIEVFDFAMLYAAADLARRGLLVTPAHVQLVMGIKNALPAREPLVDTFVSELADVLPGATWTCAAIGRHQLDANRWALARGGHVRTGLEDNIYFEKGRLAASNAELVSRLAKVCWEHGRHPAAPGETRSLLRLPVPANP